LPVEKKTLAILGGLGLTAYLLSRWASSTQPAAGTPSVAVASSPKGTGPGTTTANPSFVVGSAIADGGSTDFFCGLGYALFNLPTVGGGINRIGGTGRGALDNTPSAALATYYNQYRSAFYNQVWLPASRVSVSDLTQADLTLALQFLSQACTIDGTCPLTYGQSTEINNANNTDGWVATLTNIVGPIANIFSFGLATIVQNDVVTPIVEKDSGVASHTGNTPAQGIAELQAKMAAVITSIPPAAAEANVKVLAPTYLACEDSLEDIGAVLSASGQVDNAAQAQSDPSSLAAQQQAALASDVEPGESLLTPAQQSTAWNAWGTQTLPYDDTGTGLATVSQPSLGLDPMPVSPTKSVYIRNRLFLATATEGWWFPWICKELGVNPSPDDKSANVAIIYKRARLYRALDFLGALLSPQPLPVPGQTTSMYGYQIGAYPLQGCALPPGPNDFVAAWLTGGSYGVASTAVIAAADQTDLTTPGFGINPGTPLLNNAVSAALAPTAPAPAPAASQPIGSATQPAPSLSPTTAVHAPVKGLFV
jgi:hypothetical protein